MRIIVGLAMIIVFVVVGSVSMAALTALGGRLIDSRILLLLEWFGEWTAKILLAFLVVGTIGLFAYVVGDIILPSQKGCWCQKRKVG